MKQVYEYQGYICIGDNALDEAIEKYHEDEAVNNTDPHDYIDYDSIMAYDVYKLDEMSWDTFKLWCKQEKLNPSHAESVRKYFSEVE